MDNKVEETPKVEPQVVHLPGCGPKAGKSNGKTLRRRLLKKMSPLQRKVYRLDWKLARKALKHLAEKGY